MRNTTRIAATGEAIVARFTINADGTFHTVGSSSLPASSGEVRENAAAPPTAASGQPRTIGGQVVNGVVTGSITELSTSFNATVAPSAGPTASLAGLYTASVPGSAVGGSYIVAGPNGEAFAIAVTRTGVTAGTGTISTNGTISITTSGGGLIVGSITASIGVATVTVSSGGVTSAFTGLSEAIARTDRLINLSSRLSVVSGDSSRSVIAGFVIAGTESKRVLIRVVGPGLSGFGIAGALVNPQLQLYRGSTLVAENDNWNNSTDVSSTGDSVGAFRLVAGSRDAALVATLTPGAYTAVVTGVGGNGVALIEVYDASPNAPITAQHLVNIATRGFVDTGDGNLIAGFVVTGNAPKKLLIRGIGPGLTQFGVSGAVTDPSLRLFAAGSIVIAQNNDWNTPQPVTSVQTAATTADITAATSAAAAFPLTVGSRDAAILITLMPGNYSAVVSGAGNTIGAGLVEVYEISNP